MDIKNMSNEELEILKGKIDQEVKERENAEIDKLTEEFLDIWKRMENAGMTLNTEETGDWNGNGTKLSHLEIEINGKLITIRN